MRPIIGCTGNSAFQSQIIDMIEGFFDGNPLQFCQNREDDLSHWLGQCQAVVLAGGADIHPRTYGASIRNEKHLTKFDFLRDRRELRIIRHCLAHHIPMLGICRGHQMLGVYFGLPFCADLTKSATCHNPHKQSITVSEDEPVHVVRLLPEADESWTVPDEVMQELFKGRRGVNARNLWVNSYHHQGVLYKPNEKSQSVMVVGTASALKDQPIIEIMRGKDEPWMSVQWHPETDWQSNAASQMVLNKFKQLWIT